MERFDYIISAVDTKVCTAPVYLKSIVITPDSATVGDITLHDGESSDDPEIITLRTPSGSSLVVNFAPGLLTKRGLYLDVGSNVEDVLLQFSWGPE